MKNSSDYRPVNLKETLAMMPIWAKEKDRRYQQQKKFAEKLFGPIVKYIKQQQRQK